MIEKYLQEQKANGLKEKTIENHELFLGKANEWKPLEEWARDDATQYINSLRERCEESSVVIQKGILNKYFKWMGKPEVFAHIKLKMPKTNLRREDILTIEDVNLLIEKTSSTLYKALIAFLFESGARINEALAIRVKDTQETDKGFVVSVPTFKTGNDYRRNVYPFSAQYIRNHITYSDLGPEDKLFNVSDVAVQLYLKRLAEAAGIKKPVTPHKFRHAQATDMVLRGYQESVIRKKLGWTGDSGMISRYQHLVDEDVIDATLEKAGQDIPKHPPRANIKTAEPLKIADASLQLSKIITENEALKETVEELWAMWPGMKRYKKLEEENRELQNKLRGLSHVDGDVQELGKRIRKLERELIYTRSEALKDFAEALGVKWKDLPTKLVITSLGVKLGEAMDRDAQRKTQSVWNGLENNPNVIITSGAKQKQKTEGEVSEQYDKVEKA